MLEELAVKIHKVEAGQRIGISFENADSFAGPGALVRAIHPYGLATQAGLLVGDVVLSINGVAVSSPLMAAAALRDASGDIWVKAMRDDSTCDPHMGPPHGPDTHDLHMESYRGQPMIRGENGESAPAGMRSQRAIPMLPSSPRRAVASNSSGSAAAAARVRSGLVPSLPVGKAEEWRMKSATRTTESGRSHKALGQPESREDEFDLGLMTQRALSGFTTLLTGKHASDAPAASAIDAGRECSLSHSSSGVSPSSSPLLSAPACIAPSPALASPPSTKSSVVLHQTVSQSMWSAALR